MQITHVTTTAFLLLLASACAVTEETTAAQVDVDSSVAKTQASALTTAVTAATENDGVAVTQAVASIGQVAAALVPQTKKGARSAPALSGTCRCTSASTCTFDGCTLGDVSVTGTIAWGSGKLTCTDLAFTVNATSGSGNATVDCAITYTASSVDGTLHTTGKAVVSSSTYTWDATVTANDVSFTSSAFTGGSLDVNATGTVTTSTEATKSYTASATISLP